ncbi:HD domain-containing protein [Agrobacterium rubi]|nr:HD domain-containing protein [Agrobacterium rubi]NTF24282.1 HD domain-containing protein [Agrobacterium rubi]
MSLVLEAARDISARIPENLSFSDRAKWLLGEESVEREFVRFHSNGVAYYASKLASFIGLDERKVEEIRFGTILHDIGKLAVPETILKYPGRPPAAEMAQMKMHAAAGGILLGPEAPVLVRNIALYHHERYDGLGYNGLRGEDIPFEARIVQIADVHDALMEKRDYKPAMSEESALLMMTQEPAERAQFGRFGFDPFLLRRFVMMRLVDADFHASLSTEGKAALIDYANSPPMSDFKLEDGQTLAYGWKIDPNGNRSIRYVDSRSGNEKIAEMRNAQGALIYGPVGPRLNTSHDKTVEEEQSFISSFAT